MPSNLGREWLLSRGSLVKSDLSAPDSHPRAVGVKHQLCRSVTSVEKGNRHGGKDGVRSATPTRPALREISRTIRPRQVTLRLDFRLALTKCRELPPAWTAGPRRHGATCSPAPFPLPLGRNARGCPRINARQARRCGGRARGVASSGEAAGRRGGHRAGRPRSTLPRGARLRLTVPLPVFKSGFWGWALFLRVPAGFLSNGLKGAWAGYVSGQCAVSPWSSEHAGMICLCCVWCLLPLASCL